MGKEEIDHAKDNGKVISKAATKEHVTFSHAWLKLKTMWEEIVKNAPIPALGYGASQKGEMKCESPVA